MRLPSAVLQARQKNKEVLKWQVLLNLTISSQIQQRFYIRQCSAINTIYNKHAIQIR